MGYYRIFFDKDSYVNNQASSNNYGLDSLINLTSSAALSGTTNFNRGLVHFPIGSSQINSLTAGSYTSTLTLTNARTNQFTDSNFEIDLYAITEDWIEGVGTFAYNVSGACSYVQRTTLNAWSTSGVTYASSSSSPSASITFPVGTESLTANISAFIEYWRTNPNYGILLKMPDSVETLSSSNYYNSKAFFSRNTDTLFKPCVDIMYSTPLMFDDTNNVHLGTNTFYFTDRNVAGTSYSGTAALTYDLTSSATTSAQITSYNPAINQWYVTYNASTLQNQQPLFLIVSNTASAYSITSSLQSSLYGMSFGDISAIEAHTPMNNNYIITETPKVRSYVFNRYGAQMGTYAVNYFPQHVYLYFVEKDSRNSVTPMLEMGRDIESYYYDFAMQNLPVHFWYVPVIRVVDNGVVYDKPTNSAAFYLDDVV